MVKNLTEIHPCSRFGNTIGCVYENANDFFALKANGDNNFLDYGIAENSILFVKPCKDVPKEALRVYKTNKEEYKLTLTDIDDCTLVGMVVMSISQYA